MKLSLIVPTWNERENLPLLAERVHRSLDAQDYELIIVDDDSSDGTGEVAEKLSSKYPIRILHRKNKRGLASAVLDGIKITNSERIIVMDADLQHPPELIPELLTSLENHDMVIASRYCRGGGSQGWTLKRKLISFTANLLALPLHLRVKDKTSKFFGFRRNILTENLNSKGVWLLPEILIRGRVNKVIEIPYTFADRKYGQSKLSPSSRQIKDYTQQLIALYLYKYQRFVKFCLVSVSGAAVHFAVLYSLTDFVGLFYLLSAITAAVVGSTSNYILNHIWSFRDRRSAVKNHFIGWLKYNSTSFITDAMYIGLLAFFVEILGLWYMLGAFISAVIIAPLRFAIVSKWIWNPKSANDGFRARKPL